MLQSKKNAKSFCLIQWYLISHALDFFLWMVEFRKPLAVSLSVPLGVVDFRQDDTKGYGSDVIMMERGSFCFCCRCHNVAEGEKFNENWPIWRWR